MLLRHRIVDFLVLVSASSTLGCGSEATAPAEPPASVDLPIFGGRNAETCQWPTTVLLDRAGCTGTLVHPLIVSTAAHCGTSETSIWFGETRSSPARKVAVESCRRFQSNGPTPTDYAFCKLQTPVLDVPIVPILMGCETDILKAGQKVVVAGFGANSDQMGPND